MVPVPDLLHVALGWIPIDIGGGTMMANMTRKGDAGKFWWSVFGFVLIAVAAVASPQFAALHRNTEQAQLARLALKAARLAMLVASPILVVCLVFPDWVMGWFGAGFRAGATVLLLLTIGQLVNIGFGFTGMLLTMTGHEVIMQRILMSVTALNLILNFVLIPYLGMLGAAIAFSVTTIVQNLMAWIHVRQRLGFRCDVLALVR